MMDDLFEKLRDVDEQVILESICESFQRSHIQALLGVYKDHEKGIEPDMADLDEALDGMYKYYEDFLREWYIYEPHKKRSRATLKKVKPIYEERLKEIDAALGGTDINQKIIALDNAVNQWHLDFPVIQHVFIDIEHEHETEETTKQLEKMVTTVEDILVKLGRLPKESPYVEDPEEGI